MKKFLILWLVLLAGVSINVEAEKQALVCSVFVNDPPEPGTYQFVKSSKKKEELFTEEKMNEIYGLINNKRHRTQTVWIIVSEYTKVKVLSEEEIKKPGFTPLEVTVYEGD